MKLKPKEKELKPVHLRLNVPGQTHEDLKAYADYYKAIYKEDIEITDLVVEMTAQFLQGDTAFRRWRTGTEDEPPAKLNGGERPSYSPPADRPHVQAGN